MIFALWSPRLGGAASAYASLLTSLACYVIGSYFYAFHYPYLTSLAAALLAYVLLIPFKRNQSRINTTAIPS